MLTRILMSTFACLVIGAPAEAGATWVGAQWQFPVPAGDVGDSQLGMGVGGTFTQMHNAHAGIGADLVYHYWPASAAYTTSFDRYLRSTRLESLDGSDWAFTALQVTGHVKLVAPEHRHLAPWAQVGAGVYRLNRNLDEQRPAGTYVWVTGPNLSNISAAPGAYGSVGFDYHGCSTVLGLDATFHYLWARERSRSGVDDLPDFSAFTLGTHVLFGRP